MRSSFNQSTECRLLLTRQKVTLWSKERTSTTGGRSCSRPRSRPISKCHPKPSRAKFQQCGNGIPPQPSSNETVGQRSTRSSMLKLRTTLNNWHLEAVNREQWTSAVNRSKSKINHQGAYWLIGSTRTTNQQKR